MKKTRHNKRKKIMAVASLGGHRMQLLRIMQGLGTADADVVFVSTRDDARPPKGHAIEGCAFYVLPDFSRRDAWRLFQCLWRAWRIVGRERPDLLITTGAAPGLMALLAARMRGVKTVWIDSLANVETLSMSGKIASKFSSVTLTQWRHLETEKIAYHGQAL